MRHVRHFAGGDHRHNDHDDNARLARDRHQLPELPQHGGGRRPHHRIPLTSRPAAAHPTSTSRKTAVPGRLYHRKSPATPSTPIGGASPTPRAVRARTTPGSAKRGSGTPIATGGPHGSAAS